MTTPIILSILHTSALAFDIPLPGTVEGGVTPDQPVFPAASSTSRRIAPLLTNSLWTMAQHASYFDRDSSAMALCALLASRMVRFGAARMLSVRGRRTV